MKKLKYLFFIIPLLFIFIENSKAYDLMTCGDTVINEQTVLAYFHTQEPNDDFTDYVYFYCTRRLSGVGTCYLRKDDPSIYIVSNGTGTGRYLFKYNYASNSPYYYVEFSSCTFRNYYKIVNSASRDAFMYPYPYDPGNTYFLSNFDSTVINNTVPSPDFYTYNLLSISSPEPEPETPTIEDKIYLPDELEEGSCPIILNKDVIRVYDEEPTVNTLVSYTDYFINSHYIKQTGDDMPTDTITCLDLDNFTTSYVYRFDFDKILIIFVSILFLIAYPVMKIIHAFFVGFKRR